MDLFNIFQQGNLVLIAVFLILILMSLVSWYVIFLKGLRLKAEYRSYQQFHGEYASIKDWARIKDLSQAIKNSNNSVGELLSETKEIEEILPKYDHTVRKEILTTHLLQRLDEIRFRLDHGLTILASIGSSAPFIGLFGTVWGIYHALTNIAAQGNAGLNVVAGPMGEALVATAIGLFAAIPAVLAYNTFVRLNRLLVQNLRHVAEQLVLYTKTH